MPGRVALSADPRGSRARLADALDACFETIGAWQREGSPPASRSDRAPPAARIGVARIRTKLHRLIARSRLLVWRLRWADTTPFVLVRRTVIGIAYGGTVVVLYLLVSRL